MERRDELRPAILEHPPTEARNRVERTQQCLRAELTERDDDLRLDDVDLLEEKRLAFLDFVRLGVAVLGRTALDDVRDVDVLALQIDGLDDFRQELAGAPDKRDALDVLVRSRRLADEHQVCVRIADAENDLRTPERVELAPRAIADVRAHGGECVDRSQPNDNGSVRLEADVLRLTEASRY